MNRRSVGETNRRDKGDKKMLRIKGVYVVRCLVLLLVALNVLALWAIFFSSRGLLGYRVQTEQVRELEEKILKLKQDNQKLFDTIQALKSNPRSQEKLVRQELGWVRENEFVIEFPEQEKETGARVNPSSRKPAPVKQHHPPTAE